MDYDAIVKIDLHVHSTASDGTFTPAEILARAKQLGLAAVAITDHDSIAGSRAALAHGLPPGLKFLTGVEISAGPPPTFPHKGSLHILGYGFALDDPNLKAALLQLQEARQNRNPEILARLKKIGIHLTLEEVSAHAGEGQLGRPHIGRLMVAKGIVPSMDAAFDLYLGKGKPAYVDKYRIPCEHAIELIRKAGGVAVLAHPGLLQPPGAQPDAIPGLVETLVAQGLEGLEVYYPDHTLDQTSGYIALAERHGLLLTGGSDFHGKMQDDIEMGTGKGTLQIPFELFERLNQRITGNRLREGMARA